MSEQHNLEEFEQEQSTQQEWEERVFSDVIEVNDYPSLEKGEEHTHVGMKHIKENERKIQETVKKEYKYSKPRFKNGDTLFARITPCLENGKTSFVDVLEEGEAATGSTEFLVFSSTEDVLPKFVYYTARRPDVRQFAIKRMTGSSGRQRVPTDVFDNLSIEVPPLEDQSRIVDFLDSLDSKIEINRDIAQKVESITETYFHKIIQESNIETKTTFGQVADLRSGGPRKSTDQYTGGPHHWLTPTDVTSSSVSVVQKTERGLTDAAFEETSAEKLPVDSVFLTSRATIGEVVINKIPMAMNQGFIGLVPAGDIPSHFLMYLVKDKREVVEARASGSTYPEISQKSFADIEIGLPSEDVIQVFEEFATTAYDLIAARLSEIATLSAIRDVALPELMSGELYLSDQNRSSSNTSH